MNRTGKKSPCAGTREVCELFVGQALQGVLEIENSCGGQETVLVFADGRGLRLTSTARCCLVDPQDLRRSVLTDCARLRASVEQLQTLEALLERLPPAPEPPAAEEPEEEIEEPEEDEDEA